MISNDPIRKLISAIPESFKRLLRFARNPFRHLGAEPDIDIEYVLLDFLASLPVVAVLVAAMGQFLPNYIEINPMNILRMELFLVLLTVNAVTFSLCLWLVSMVVLVFSGVRLHGAIFYQGIKSYAFLNIPAAIIFVIALNRIVVVGDFNVSTGTGDLLFAAGVAVFGFALGVWLVAVPLGRYMRSRYRAAVAYPLGIAVFFVASFVNPVVASEYFNNILDKEEFCKQYISFQKKDVLRNGTYNKDCLIGKCMAVFEGSSSNKGMEPTH